MSITIWYLLADSKSVSKKSSCHYYNTRASYKQSFSRSGAELWNEIPCNIRHLPKNKFKKVLRKLLFDILKNCFLVFRLVLYQEREFFKSSLPWKFTFYLSILRGYFNAKSVKKQTNGQQPEQQQKKFVWKIESVIVKFKLNQTIEMWRRILVPML